MISGPGNQGVVSDEPAREFVVAVLALIRQPLLESSDKPLPRPALRLGQSVCGLPQFVRVRNLLASREGDEGVKTRINADSPMPLRRDTHGRCVDEQAQIPARRPLHHPPAFDAALGQV
jgi:hypothetical protein